MVESIKRPNNHLISFTWRTKTIYSKKRAWLLLIYLKKIMKLSAKFSKYWDLDAYFN